MRLELENPKASRAGETGGIGVCTIGELETRTSSWKTPYGTALGM